jgi:hypothetical protein
MYRSKLCAILLVLCQHFSWSKKLATTIHPRKLLYPLRVQINLCALMVLVKAIWMIVQSLHAALVVGSVVVTERA